MTYKRGNDTGVEFIRTYQGILVAMTVRLRLGTSALPAMIGIVVKGLDKLAFL
jgi:hypothetical protein